MPLKSFLASTASLDRRVMLSNSNEMLLDDCVNIQLSPKGDVVGRKGCQDKCAQKGGYGTSVYSYIQEDGSIINEILVVDDQMHRIDLGAIKITYSGSSSHISVSILVDSGEFHLKIIEGGVQILNRNLGIGYEESATDTISATVSAIDALANITCTLSAGSGSLPSAFLDLTPDLHIASGRSACIQFKTPTQIYSPNPTPFSILVEHRNSDLLENVNFCNHNNLLYIADKGPLKIYDGQSFYRAGLPVPPQPIYTLQVGDFEESAYYYISYEYTDTRGKHTESELSDELEIIMKDQEPVLTIKTLEASSGYNTNCAIVNGGQTATSSGGSVTLTVGNGMGGAHSIRAGDFVSIYNRTTDINEIKTYEVTSITSTTIVVDSDETITVVDGDVISAQLLINIYRSSGTNATKYLLKQYPNNSFVASIQHTDHIRKATADFQQVESIGNQVILTVDVGSDLLKGDIVSLFNFTTEVNSEQQFEVLDLTGTALTLKSSVSVELHDDAKILLHELTFIPFTPFFLTQGAPPESVSYVDSYKGNLILANGSRLYYSEEINNGNITSSQSFSPVNFIQFNAPINALYSLGDYIYVFTQTGLEAVVSSSLSTAPYNRITISTQITCTAHSSLTAIGLELYFVSDSGIYCVSGTQLSSNPLSDPIGDFFLEENQHANYNLRRAVGFNDIFNRHLWFFIPAENSSNTDFCLPSSKIFVWDYFRRSWFEWSGLNFAGGATIGLDFNEILLSERTSSRSLRRNLRRISQTNTSYDYLDHVKSIDVWMALKWNALDSSAMGLQKRVHSLSLFQRPIMRYPPNSYPTMNIRIYRDLVDNLLSTSTSIIYDEPGAKWNEFAWNSKPIGSWQKAHKKIKASADVVESVKIWVGATLSATNFNLSGLEMDWDYLDQKQLKT